MTNAKEYTSDLYKSILCLLISEKFLDYKFNWLSWIFYKISGE